jgi:hypothetical protein
MSSPARRTNTVLAVIAAAVLVIGIVVAIFGTPTSAPSVDDVSNPTSPTSSSQDSSPNLPSLRSRNADTSASWFTHTFASEQFDFPMDQLDCEEMRRFLSLELCVVATTSRGDFMVTATEGFWDAQSTSRNPIEIELNFMVYVHTSDNGPARAMSILDGSVNAPYETSPSTVKASTFSIAQNDVVVLEWSSGNEGSRRSNRAWSSVQVLAMNNSGLPEIVATYAGTNISLGATASSLVLTSDRFGPPSRSAEAEPWLTVLTLSPPSFSTSSSTSTAIWREGITTQSASSFDTSSLGDTNNVSTYEFPRRSGAS